jgi:hypothetical protein
MSASRWTIPRKPGESRGRKARDLPPEDRPVAGIQRRDTPFLRCAVKAKLMRIAVAVSLLATMVLSLAAGLKW